jgi:hypothetical protein
MLTYPSAGSRGVEFFGPADVAQINSLDVWRLKSAWK